MENYVIVHRDSELYHHGIKGMRWGQRRYQNKDGSLTPAGKKRYNKELANIKKEKDKLKAEQKVASNRKKTQAKFDKLEAEKKKLAEQKKALKEDSKGKSSKDNKPEETPEQKRERLLKSVDAKEIYKNKELLTDAEINARINRIDLESRLSSKIPVEKSRVDQIIDGMSTASKTIETATNVFDKIDKAYSTVANSTLAKAVGIDLPSGKKEVSKTINLEDFYKDINNRSMKEIADAANVAKNATIIKNYVKGNSNTSSDNSAKTKEYEAGKRQYEEYNRKLREEAERPNTTYRKHGSNLTDTTLDTNERSTETKSDNNTKSGSGKIPLLENVEKVSGTVEGEGTSKSSIKEKWDASKSKNKNKRTYTEDDIIDMEVSSSSMSNVPAVFTQNGRVIVTALLEELE